MHFGCSSCAFRQWPRHTRSVANTAFHCSDACGGQRGRLCPKRMVQDCHFPNSGEIVRVEFFAPDSVLVPRLELVFIALPKGCSCQHKQDEDQEDRCCKTVSHWVAFS